MVLLASLVGCTADATDGADGLDGKNGAVGQQGPAGKDGEDGKDGAPGPKGDKGDRGAPGLNGGADGKDGAQGPQGIQGPMGPAGVNGVQGPKGDPGTPGTNGTNGSGIVKDVLCKGSGTQNIAGGVRNYVAEMRIFQYTNGSVLSNAAVTFCNVTGGVTQGCYNDVYMSSSRSVPFAQVQSLNLVMTHDPNSNTAVLTSNGSPVVNLSCQVL